jgi:hypothetical protein
MASWLRVRVASGPGAGTELLLRPADRAIAGRGADCQMAIPDSGLSRKHLELAWDGTSCRLTDLGSTNGTLVNGRLVKEALLRPGDRIEAGDTVLAIEPCAGPDDARPESAAGAAPSVAAAAGSAAVAAAAAAPEPAAPPPGPGDPRAPVEVFTNVEPSTIETETPPPEPGTPLAALASLLAEGAAEDRLYAIVDGSQAIELAMAARVGGERLYTLFEGDMAQHVAHAGPILIPVEKPLPFLTRWVEALGKSAGILLQTPADLPTLFAQLRHVFVVKDEEGQEYFLRFYDPRVFRGFLPTCTPEQRAEFFGPIRRWIVENEAGDAYGAVVLAEGKV